MPVGIRSLHAALALGLVVGTVALAGGCADKGNDRIPAAASLTLDANSGTVVSTTTSSSLAAIGPSAGSASSANDGALHAAGEAVRTASGNTITLHAVDPAAPGGRYAVEVEACATAAAARVGPTLFSIELGNGTSLPPVGDGKAPALTDGDVTRGACRRGWVSFQLPPDQAPAALVFRGSSLIRWSLA